METAVAEAVRWLKLAIELTSVAIVGVGFVVILREVAQGVVRRQPLGFNAIRLGLARYLALALELQLGADIIGTAISPSWEQIGELAAIAVIRTGLNYFLSREIKEETALVREEATQVSSDGSATVPSRP